MSQGDEDGDEMIDVEDDAFRVNKIEPFNSAIVNFHGVNLRKN